MAGHGDMDLAFKKTANALLFCATSPDPNKNGVHGHCSKMVQYRGRKKRRKWGALAGHPNTPNYRTKGLRKGRIDTFSRPNRSLTGQRINTGFVISSYW